MTSLRVLSAALLTAGCMLSVQAQSLRPEVGKPLQQASDLLRAGKAKEALAKVHEADSVGGKNPSEQLMIDRMRGSAAQGNCHAKTGTLTGVSALSGYCFNESGRKFVFSILMNGVSNLDAAHIGQDRIVAAIASR